MRIRALAEADGRIKEQRVNEDVLSRAALQRLEQDRVTRLASIAAFFEHLSSNVAGFMMDPQRVSMAVLGLTATAGGIYAMRETARVAGRIVERRLVTPSLVRETSRFGGLAGLYRRLWQTVAVRRGVEGYSLNDVVVPHGLQIRIDQLAPAIRNTRVNSAPHRHLLFYGPPGARFAA